MLEDTEAPEVGGTDTVSEDGGQTLVAEPDESADETLTTDFYLSEGIDLSEANMEVASGSVTGNTPEAINPMEC